MFHKIILEMKSLFFNESLLRNRILYHKEPVHQTLEVFYSFLKNESLKVFIEVHA